MIPAFGFSVGDFIAAIGLCTKVAKTLKGSSGVSAEYQQVIIEIEGLQDALTRLARLEPTESNIDHVNAIRRMALACSLPMQDFLSKLERYEGSMSPFTTGKSIRSVGKKAEYAVFMSEEVKTMRTMISGKVISINLLLATHASETLSRTQDRLSTNQENLLSRLEEAKVGLSRIRQDIENMNTASCTSQERFEQETGAHLIQIGNDNASTKRSISALAIGVSSISTSITTLCRLGTQIQSILSTFPAELRDLLQTVVRTNMQMYTVLLEVHRKISAPPTLALDSNIRTEDALGVVRSLPYEWFRHWESFEGLLRAEFKNRLGAERVEREEFSLVHAKRPAISIDKSNWSQTITSGADILMLMRITNFTCQEFSCPRPSCSGRTALKAQLQTMLTCPECGLRFMSQLVLPEGTDANIIEQLQIEEDARLFGMRDEPGSDLIGELPTVEASEHGYIDRLAEDVEYAERARPSTRFKSPIDQKTPQGLSRKREASPRHIKVPPEPPIYAWLADTEPPKDPDSVLRWREAEEIHRVKRQKQNDDDLEVFRNVEIAVPLKDDIPTKDPQESGRLSQTGFNTSITGAYMFYRNIRDRYPQLMDPLAWRFANANWKRLENFQRNQRADLACTLDQTAPPNENRSNRFESSSEKSDNVSVYSTFPSRWFRQPWKQQKMCSLPPLPNLKRLVGKGILPQDQSHRGYSATCHLCNQKVHLLRKRDWSNHVMDDLIPYMCPIPECSAGNDRYARRRDLSNHLKRCHPSETCLRCPFCSKKAVFDLIKHLGYHMEDIAFSVLKTTAEECPDDDTDSADSLPSCAGPFAESGYREWIQMA